MRFTVLILIVLTAGCAGMSRAPSGTPPETAAAQPESAAVAPAASPATRPAAPSKVEGVAKADSPSTKSAAKSPAPTAQVPKQSPALAGQEGPQPLDLPTLEKRLKETNAIGVLTKIKLKNDIDDLLQRFRAYYRGQLATTLADLRQPFETLFLKVLALLQDSDPALAKSIAASREAIWRYLSDRSKFANL